MMVWEMGVIIPENRRKDYILQEGEIYVDV